MAERTLLIIKPDGVQRHLVGTIISRFESKGLKLVAAKFMQIPKEMAQKHYSVHKDKPFYDGVVNYLASAPSLVMVWEAAGVIEMARKMMGSTFGNQAQPGTIRGDFGCSRGYNLIHGSDSPQSAQTEIELFFGSGGVIDYELSDEAWLYGSNE